MTEVEKKAGNKRKRQSSRRGEPGYPKRPKTAYALYSDEKRKELKDKEEFLVDGKKGKKVDMKALQKEIKRMWGDLNDEEKKPFVESNAELMKDFEIKVQEFERDHPVPENNEGEEDDGDDE